MTWGPRNLDVHIWLYDVDRVMIPDSVQLSIEESWQAEQLMFGPDRALFVTAHRLLRLTLCKYLGRAPGEITILRDRAGKFFLKKTFRKTCRFDFAYRDDRVIVGICDTGLGIDIQRIDDDTARPLFEKGYFSVEERQAILEIHNPAARTVVLHTLWSMKEAFIKAVGYGLSAPMPLSAYNLLPFLDRPYNKPVFDIRNVWYIDSIPVGSDCAAACALKTGRRSVNLNFVYDNE